MSQPLELDGPQHGVAEACYTLVGPDGYEPHMGCLCGAQFTASTWAECGGEMDDHLEAVGATT